MAEFQEVLEEVDEKSKLFAHKDQDDEEQYAGSSGLETLPCLGLEGAHDVVLIIKTGSTEAMEKLPVHFQTTLNCYKHHLIFSDFSEILEGHAIHDALDQVTEEIRLGDQAFELWRRLQDGGRHVLDQSDLSTNDKGDPESPYGNMNNGGWRLDKMKNVPMIGKTLEQVPNAKWYVFTDADTYIVQSNLLQWTRQLNHKDLVYMGNPTVINDQLFAHGGSGYILSSAAMYAATAEYEQNQEYWDRNAAGHWAVDCVLGTLLQKVGAELIWAFPIVQRGDPTRRDWQEIGYDKKLWCYPSVSYHHVKPETIISLFNFEQSWIAADENADNASPMRHSDVFKMLIQPQLSYEKSDWDNASDLSQEGQEVDSALGCRALCEDIRNCFQYSYKEGVCKTATTPKLGARSEEGRIVSGWMLGRIHRLAQELNWCGGQGEWILG
ncbi:hypothetical protein EJ03DRAFT_268041 [Teratosphaeria nubilosa]|uniref:N-acetylgalactosaminide beta-1,3-galactosyltransferase n=1 Tax=Teratosphaeria nubilosa TaxID=161662 RepID=A0A6G1LFM3_9PEZI|nr:hypothetical protein EJ03DRAFT_268041 [Teratosphaeria nubilosa]